MFEYHLMYCPIMKKGTCKYFNGSFHNTHCDAGICYNDVTPNPHEPGSAIRKPCMKYDENDEHALKVIEETGPQGTCDLFEEPSDGEIQAFEAEIEKATKRMLDTLPIMLKIKSEHAGIDWSGNVICPICGGDLFVTHAKYNGHTSGRCSTVDCVSWIE